MKSVVRVLVEDVDLIVKLEAALSKQVSKMWPGSEVESGTWYWAIEKNRASISLKRL